MSIEPKPIDGVAPEANSTHWTVFNFLARRVFACAFIFGGLVIAVSALPALLPGGTIKVDGQPSTDLVFRLVGVLLPLGIVLVGVALYRVAPYYPVQPKERR